MAKPALRARSAREDAAAPQLTAPSGGGRAVLVAAAAAAAAAFVALVVLLYAASAHAVPGNSDGATVILEGQALSTGHLTLHHWFLSFDSFWGVDALFYAVAVLVAGVRPELLNLVPAVIAALVVVVGMSMARAGRRGAAAVAGALTVFALLGLPSYALAIFFLQGPLHVGTALWCLLAFAGLSRPQSRRAWIVAVLLLAAGNVGDLQTLAFGVTPAFLAGVVAMLRRRAWRAGIAPVTASAASVLLAAVVREVAKLVGTFTVNKSNGVATHHQMVANLGLVAKYGAKLLGVGSRGFGSGGVPGPLLAVHVAGLVLVVAGVVVAAVDLLRGVLAGRGGGSAERDGWRLDDLLVLAFFGDVAVFVILTPAANASYARYLTAAVVFGAILAGRLVARLATVLAGRWVARAAAAAGAVAVACFAAAVGYVLSVPVGEPPTAQLGRFLEAHHLHDGIGDYWSSSIVTVETRDAVEVRPVTAVLTGRIVSYTRNSSSTWYAGKSFQFLAYNSALPFGDVDAATAARTFGPPSRTYAVDGYLVLVWPHRISVASGAS